MRMLRKAGWLLAALLCASPLAGPVAAGGCPHSLDVFLVRRVGTAPRPLRLEVASNPRTALGTVLVVAVRGRGPRRVVPDDGLYTGWIGHSSLNAHPVVYTSVGGGYRPVPLPSATTPEEPPDAALCDLADRGGTSAPIPMVDRDEPTTDDFVVGAYDVDVRLELSPGWTVSRLTGGRMRMLTRHHAGGTGVQAGPDQVEYFGGTPPVHGGQWGSVAVASIPCWPLGWHAAGVGAAVLVGGGPEVPGAPTRRMSCGAPGLPFGIGGSSGPTTWRVAGEAAGRTSIVQRLTVFDLPPT